jgi:6-phosphogluconate dehydrogenase (decarboxylating)
MLKVTVGEDGWAMIRDPRKLTERLSARIEDAQFELMSVPAVAQLISDQGAEAAEDIQSKSAAEQMSLIGAQGFRLMRNVKYATILAYVESWSFGDVTEDVLLDLTATEVNELSEEIGKVIKAVGGPKLDTSVDPTPGSPT